MNRILHTLARTAISVGLVAGLAVTTAAADVSAAPVASPATTVEARSLAPRAGLWCGPLYVPYQQMNGSYVGLLSSRNWCGPRKAMYDVRNASDFAVAYQIGVGRCVAFNTNPAIAGNGFAILGKFAWTWYQAANFCQNRGWYYVYTY